MNGERLEVEDSVRTLVIGNEGHLKSISSRGFTEGYLNKDIVLKGINGV